MSTTSPLPDPSSRLPDPTSRVGGPPERNVLAPAIARLAVDEGANQTRHPAVHVYRVSEPEVPTPTLYPACVIVVGQGGKRAHLAEDCFAYDTKSFLVIASPIPMHCEVAAQPDVPTLTFSVTLDLALLGEVAAALAKAPPPAENPERAVQILPLGDTIEQVSLRLLSQLDDPESAAVLAPLTIRELYFHLLRGPGGPALHALVNQSSNAAAISRVMRHIHEHFATPLHVEELAQIAHMSVPSFYAHFKAVTATSPLQYLKDVRLNKARALMLHRGVSAKNAAHQVGYASESQFSREFRRMFGAPPAATKRSFS